MLKYLPKIGKQKKSDMYFYIGTNGHHIITKQIHLI